MITTNRLTTSFVGRSTDVKPSVKVRNGSRFYEIDTQTSYIFDEEHSQWVEFSPGSGGGGGGGSTKNLKVGTKAQWDSQPTLIAEKDVVYVYSDYKTSSSGLPIPAFKVGDGKAYLIDMPFNDGMAEVDIKPTDVESWNNKVTAVVYEDDPTNLVLSKI